MGVARGVALASAGLREVREVDEHEDERELLARAAARDDRAVRRLYRAHVDRVHRLVARILGPADADVEDVVQQVFLAALDGARKFDGRSSVSTWVLGIAMRRALDHARARWRRDRWTKLRQTVGLGRGWMPPDQIHGARTEAEALLARLRPELRSVFVLHEVEGYTLAEIREMSGVSTSTLHARLKTARKKLDEMIETDDELGGSDE